MTNSILSSTKKVLGIEEDYTAFDVDITMHINSVFTTLHQLGIGPEDGFMIESKDEEWQDFIGDNKLLNAVKTYVYMRVRLIFDPPPTSFAIEAMQNQVREHEWRLNVHREFTTYPTPLVEINSDEITTDVEDPFAPGL